MNEWASEVMSSPSNDYEYIYVAGTRSVVEDNQHKYRYSE